MGPDLRDGLLWHDGEPCWRAIASRALGGGRRATLWRRTDGEPTNCQRRTTAPSAFGEAGHFRVAAALGSRRSGAVMMPERLANQDAFKPLTEVVAAVRSVSSPTSACRAPATSMPASIAIGRARAARRIWNGGGPDRALRSRGLEHDAGLQRPSCGAADRRAGLAGNHAGMICAGA